MQRGTHERDNLPKNTGQANPTVSARGDCDCAVPSCTSFFCNLLFYQTPFLFGLHFLAYIFLPKLQLRQTTIRAEDRAKASLFPRNAKQAQVWATGLFVGWTVVGEVSGQQPSARQHANMFATSIGTKQHVEVTVPMHVFVHLYASKIMSSSADQRNCIQRVTSGKFSSNE